MEKYFLTVDKNGEENVQYTQPFRNEEENYWAPDEDDNLVKCMTDIMTDIGRLDIGMPLPKGRIEELIGKKLTWEDEPYIYETQTPDIDFNYEDFDDGINEDDDEDDVFDVICPNCNKTFECGWSDFVIDNDRYYYRCDRCGTLIRHF